MRFPARKDLEVLCYQHHRKMFTKPNSESTGGPLYVCQEMDCLVRYDSSKGYFLDTADKKAIELEILPHVSCPSDGCRHFANRSFLGT